MGDILDRVIGSPADHEPTDYAPVDFRSKTVADGAGLSAGLRFGTIETQQHLLQVKDAIYAGDITIVEIATQPGGGLSRDRILNDLCDAVDDVSGDIARRDQNTYVITPPSVTLHRESIGPSR